ncbi:MAG: hypothetical protein ACPHO6_14110, partial [Candidatus Latescibacterota bacterium]
MKNRLFSVELPFGKAPALLVLVTALTGLYLFFHPVETSQATLRLWTFASNHAVPYQKAIPSFEAAHPGTQLEVQLV